MLAESASRARRIALLLTLVVAMLALPSAAADARNIVYFGNYTSNSISAMQLGSDGTPAPLSGSPVASPGSGTRTLIVSPDGKGLLYGNDASDDYGSMVVGGNGTLSAQSAFGSFTGPRYAAFSPDGNNAYVASSFSNFGIGQVNRSGSTFTQGTTYAATANGNATAVTPDGRFVYAGSGTSMYGFARAANGSLTPLPGFPTGLDPAQLGVEGVAVNPAGTVLYTTDQSTDKIYSYLIGSDGSLTEIGSGIGSGGLNPIQTVVAPSGKTLYVLNGGTPANAGVQVFTINGDGSLAALGSLQLTAGYLSGIAITPDGKFVLSQATLSGNNINIYAVQANGTLTTVAGSPFASGANNGGNGTQSIAVLPNQGPTAKLAAVTPAQLGAATAFNGGASSDSDGTIASYDWDFGDGSSLNNGGPTPTHAYTKPGVYIATLTVTDELGCSTSIVWGSTSAYCNGTSAARASVKIDTPPNITGFTLTNRKFAVASASKRVKRGTRFSYNLSEAASVKISFAKQSSGRLVAGKCKKQTRANKKRKRCALATPAGAISQAGKTGANRLNFSGKIGKRKLKPGTYTATAVATDSAGGKSTERSVRFSIVRR